MRRSRKAPIDLLIEAHDLINHAISYIQDYGNTPLKEKTTGKVREYIKNALDELEKLIIAEREERWRLMKKMINMHVQINDSTTEVRRDESTGKTTD